MMSVRVKTPGIARMIAAVTSQQFARRLLGAWGVIYRLDLRERFARFSRGGGNWARLAESTARRKRSNAILRDTDALFMDMAGLDNSTSCVQMQIQGDSMEVSLGGGRMYEDGQTTGDVAGYHQEGGPNLPRRLIIVQPSQPALQRMRVKGRQITVTALKGRGAA